ncbi:MAG: hypothetical protein M3495_16875 [Pseudomonadota bacterium]|nr:hypothetical protein [Gammaproteobacteria bacterium]MDQ3583166.1 hypothetical protein [Pseudomonadota bacterium]
MTRFQEELTRAAALPGFASVGSALWPRFAGYYQGLTRLPRRLRRALQRRWQRSLGGLALLLAIGPAPALARPSLSMAQAAPWSTPSPPPTTTRPQAVVRRAAARTPS